MKAMILAAGYGTRLKPLTDTLPKALIPFRAGTMLSYQINKLKQAGIDEIIINTHHFKEKIFEYIYNNDFGIRINLTDEKEILGTGGGILNAAGYFSGDEKLFVMNVDVYTDYDIKKLITLQENNFASLLVQKRATSRYLKFDEGMKLADRIQTNDPQENDFAYNGMMVLSTDFFNKGFEIKYGDILSLLMSLKESEVIKGINAGDCIFADLGKAEALKKYNI